MLVKAYDDAIKLTKAEVAKRLANLTNKQGKGSVSESTDNEMDSESKLSETNAAYKVGQFVRATYDADGVDYEARIIEIYENGDGGEDCLLQFIGYGNEQIVPIADLLPSWGRKARRQQMSQAAEEVTNMDFEDDAQQETNGPVNAGRTQRQSNATRASATNAHSFNGHFGSSLMIPPPPPMPPMLNELTEDSEHLSAMLMAWYMSGYYTGLYQGQKIAKATTATMHSMRNKK